MAAAAAAVAVREDAAREAARRKAARKAADKKKRDALAALSSGPVGFAQALQALKAAQAAEEAGGEGAVVLGVEALYGPSPPPEVRGKSGKTYNNLSIFCLAPAYEPRRLCISIVESRPFDPLILVTIMCNCVTMAWESPLDPCCTWKAGFIDVCEWVYLYIFTFELTVKIIAYGFLMHEGSYLRDPWCQLDFVVVSLAWIPILIPSFGNYSVIRSVRALRPLRALKRVPGMPILVSSIISCIPKMGNVAGLCGFIFLVFGIVGMELFKGALHYRCAEPGYVETPGHPVSERRLAEVSVPLLSDAAARLYDAVSGAITNSAADAAPTVLTDSSMALQHSATASHGVHAAQELAASLSSRSMLRDETGRRALTGAAAAAATAAVAAAAAAAAVPDLNATAAAASRVAVSSIVRAASVASRRILRGGGVSDGASQDSFDTGKACRLGGPADQCDPGQTCAYFDENPANGMMSFDSVGNAFVILLQAITFDDWATSMYALELAFSPSVWVYYVTIIMLGGFFVINLFLAVIFTEFIAAQNAGDGGAAAAEAPAPTPNATDRAPLLDGELARSDGSGATAPRSCCDCAPPATGCRAVLRDIGDSSALGNFSTFLVLLNMGLMCAGYEGMTEQYAASLESAATVITWIFIVEMFVKLLGFGCAGYWADGWNQLDGSIVIMSIVEIVVTALLAGGGMNLSFLRMLRMLRVLRMLRLMKAWKGLYKIVTTFGKAIPQMSNLFVLMFLIMVIFSLLGMQLFGGLYNEENGFSLHEVCGNGWGDPPCPNPDLEPLPKYNFDYFGPAMSAVFVIFSGEWIDAMDPAIHSMGPAAVPYFIVVVLLGKYLIMNLLIAILLNAFADDSDDPPDEPDPAARAARRKSRKASLLSPGASTSRTARTPFEEWDETLPKKEVKWPRDFSLCVFSPYSKTRVWTRKLIAHPAFDQVIIAAIIVSSICLALDSPRNDPDSTLALVLKKLDLFWTALFATELTLKVITLGFCFGKDAYVTSPWNLLDLAIVCVSFAVLLADVFPALRPLKTLRILRVLRPLRLVSRNPGMKLIVSSLIKALPAVSNVFGVVFALQLVFAILGMQLFSGTLASCTKPDLLTKEECLSYVAPSARFLADLPTAHAPGAHHAGADGGVDAFLAGQLTGDRRILKGGGGGEWEEGDPVLWQNSPKGSFDNFGDAMRLLYIMSSGDEWESPMYLMQGAVAPGIAPQRNDFSWAALYTVAWMFVGSFFALNLFVGVIVDNFNRIRKESDSSAHQTPEQVQWIKTVVSTNGQRPMRIPRAPENCFRRIVFHIISSAIFDNFIMLVIVLNVGTMACDYWGIEQNTEDFALYTQAMSTFANIYYCEATLKITALGCAYFEDNWCRFDFFLVCTSLIDQFATELLAAVLPMPPMLLRVLRVARILRILRLLKGAKELRNLIVTMVLSFPSLMNVGSMLALVTFIYAVLGVNMFTWVIVGDFVTEQRNFHTMSQAMLLLFQCLTGDNWSGMMTDMMVQAEGGLCTVEAGNCGSMTAIPYFVSFQVLGSFVFLNLVVAVILENFAALGAINSEYASTNDMENFKESWAEFDPDGTGYLTAVDIPKLLMSTPGPLGLKGVEGKREVHAIQLALQLRLVQRDGFVAFQEVLDALIRHNYFQNEELQQKRFEEHQAANWDSDDSDEDEQAYDPRKVKQEMKAFATHVEREFDNLLPVEAKATPAAQPPPPDVAKLRPPSFKLPRLALERDDVSHTLAVYVLSKHISNARAWRAKAIASSKAQKRDGAAIAEMPGLPSITENAATVAASAPGSALDISVPPKRVRGGGSGRTSPAGSATSSARPTSSSRKPAGRGRGRGGGAQPGRGARSPPKPAAANGGCNHDDGSSTRPRSPPGKQGTSPTGRAPAATSGVRERTRSPMPGSNSPVTKTNGSPANGVHRSGGSSSSASDGSPQVAPVGASHGRAGRQVPQLASELPEGPHSPPKSSSNRRFPSPKRLLSPKHSSPKPKPGTVQV